MDLVEVSGAATRRHPWEEARYRFFAGVLNAAGVLGPAAKLLDVGAGDGWLAQQVAASHHDAEVVCWDTGYSEDADRLDGSCRFTAVRPSARFDVVLLLDVLEHVQEDDAFLSTLVETNLRPGGHLLFSVPAWQSLFSSHDVRLRHHRRYAPRRCRGLLAAAGLEIVRAGGLFHSLLPVRALMTLAERSGLSRSQAHVGEWRGSAAATSIVGAGLACDTRISQLASAAGWDLPGLSWWALCRRPSL